MKLRLLLSSVVLFLLAFADYARADIARLTVEVDRDALCSLCEPMLPQSEAIDLGAPVQFATYERGPSPVDSLAAVPPEKPPACGLGTSPSVCKPRPRHWAAYSLGLMAPLPDAAVDDGVTTSPSAQKASLPDVENDAGAYLKSLGDAVKAGKWLVFAALLVNLLVWALRKWGAKLVPWFGEKTGGYFLAGFVSLGTAFALSAITGKVDVGVLLEALGLAMTAIGQHQTGKDKAGRAS